MPKHRKTALILGAALLAMPFHLASAQVVRTDLGAVRGAVVDGGVAYRGIPFAAPPVGENRWRPPAPAAPWSEERDATEFGPSCPQPENHRPVGGQSEDCLTLNVVAPEAARREGARLPVLFSIHGGAFAFGSGRSLADNDVSPIVRDGVVLVSPNYRVGRFGFFAHPALTAEAGERGGMVGNYWLMDQLAALDWVRRNIASFGGDPDNITILGCSAGGSSVNSLLASPLARGMFAKASVRSGGGIFNATRPLAVAEEQGLAFAQRAGVTGADAAALTRLRRLSIEQILAADPGPPNYGAIVDGTALPIAIPEAYATGAIHRVPTMIGSTSNEASVFGLMGFDAAVLRSRFDIDLEALRPAYAGASGTIDDAELLRQVQTDFMFTSAVMATSAFAADAGSPVWTYHFDYVDTAHRGQTPGAAHCADMGYVFGTLQDPSPEDAALSRTMQSYLLNFMRNGDPNGAGLPEWPRQAADHSALLIQNQVQAVAPFRARQMEPWYRKAQETTGGRGVP